MDIGHKARYPASAILAKKVSLVLRIAVSGYYGFKNAGDDAILMAMVSTIGALAPGAEITVFSNSPAETRQMYGVRAVNRWNPFGVIWALLRSDLLLSGGGGLLQDVTGVRSICYYLVVVLLALAAGKPVVYYAQGVGPVHTRFGRWFAKVVSNKVDLITVRDHTSREDLLAMGICRPPMVITADPVLALNPSQLTGDKGAEMLDALRLQADLISDSACQPSSEDLSLAEGPSEPVPAVADLEHPEETDPDLGDSAAADQTPVAKHRLGIVVRDWSDNDRYKKCIAAAADRFARAGWEVVLFPFHYPGDVKPSRDVASLMQEPHLLACNWLMVGTLFGLLGELDLVLAMRLHAIVMASVMRVPCVGIAYDPKVERFLEMTGQPNAGSTDDLEEDQLYQVMLDAWERRQEIIGQLDKILPHLRQQAWETASLMLSVFYARSPKKRREFSHAGGRGSGETVRGSANSKSRSAK